MSAVLHIDVPPVATHSEVLTWIQVTPASMPDVDETVFVSIDVHLEADDSEPVWLAWWDGEAWREPLGNVIVGQVVSWARMPEGFFPGRVPPKLSLVDQLEAAGQQRLEI